MENAVFPVEQNNPDFNKNAIPVRMGIITALVSIVTLTCVNLFLVHNLFAYGTGIVIALIINILLLGYTGKQQRKAMGGYITIKEAFSAIFIAILILVGVGTVYSYIYLHFIDPDFAIKMKETSLAFAERMGANQSALDEAAKKSDESIQKSTSISTQMISVAWGIVMYSIFGFICAAIVKKDRPQAMR